MKIHIVQKGDTLWKIAKKYGVDSETLKQANAQLSNPDLIMPGMKIKVPSTSAKYAGGGSAPPKEYVKQTIPAQSQNLTILDEDEQQAQTGPASEQPAMQMPMSKQKETQLQTVQKETQITTPQKEKPVTPTVQKPEAPIAAKPAQKPEAPIAAKPAQKPESPLKDVTKFSVNILPQPPQPPSKTFNMANEFKVPATKTEPIATKPANKDNTIAPAAQKDNVVAPAFEAKKDAVQAAKDNQNTAPAANKAMPMMEAPSFTAPAANKATPLMEVPSFTAPAANKAMPMMEAPSFTAPAANKAMPMMETPSFTAPAANKAMPIMNAPNFTAPVTDKTMPVMNEPVAPPAPEAIPGVMGQMDVQQPYSSYNNMPPVDPGMYMNPGYPQYGSPMMPYDMNPYPMPYDMSPMPYAPQYPPQGMMPYMPPTPYPPPYAPQGMMPYMPPMPYAPQYPPQGMMPYMPPAPQYPMPYPEYVQGVMQESSSLMQPNHHAPYESSSLYMPNAAPGMDNYPPQAQGDCGCDDQQSSYPYAPPPMSGGPYYPFNPQQAPYYQSMPYVPYAPQPMAPYYRPDQAAMFGVPSADDDTE
ncbi:SafA/ExsA family spore coat assembly protein [Ectobacillus antri]|uniref:SafA/ExsA family spore coat assembly protein n=1 Tax=Ectobacillus antri TaxID=2486280 RepID=A0ABT6H1U8_9BACI|nr:SafA/ExsA family spore coat assembly protein [Ectobacillus antri]MDG4655386.1 SafA/ExsA family spore coat assembly protein [Ectobacillus antri]MDG5753144.1 SafA/ExsA family spore coat assembly protein [Ectobacillus antri]